jgi:hypothetical protein
MLSCPQILIHNASFNNFSNLNSPHKGRHSCVDATARATFRWTVCAKEQKTPCMQYLHDIHALPAPSMADGQLSPAVQ